MENEESTAEEDKGPIAYQEQKVFSSEDNLCSVYDNTVKRFVTFEVYGLDTQAQLFLKYDYPAFDNLFRFNAELMNPNRKEGRFHWIIERLEISTATKDRKLKLSEKPTEEVSQMPLYETVRKIPTGRMDLKERQRLREQMDMLDIRREENISKKRAATKEKFLKHIFALKDDDRRRKEEQDQKIEQERSNRYKQKEDTERKEEEEGKLLDVKAKARRKAVECHEARTEEQEEYELAQLRLRWKANDVEKARVIQAARDRRAKMNQEEKEAKAALDDKRREAQNKRKTIWRQLAERRKRKESDWLKKVFEQKAERKRTAKMQNERNQEFIKEWHRDRQPIFKQAIQKTEERQQARLAEEEAVANYNAQRAPPPKVNLKGKNSKKAEMAAKKEAGATAKPEKEKPKKKAKKAEGDGEKKPETDAEHVEKVLDAVEDKMRAQMEEEKRRARLDIVRTDKVEAKERGRIDTEMKHVTEVKEAFRKKKLDVDQINQQRTLIRKQKSEDERKKGDRKKSESERLNRTRNANIERLEMKRLAAEAA